MFGLSGSKLVILLIIALVVIGPRRVPEYAQKLRDTVRSLKRWALDVREGMQDQLGDEFAEVDWQKLDPRQYDPRRIVREALSEDDDHPDIAAVAAVDETAWPMSRHQRQAAMRDTSKPAPFDPEAT